MLGLIEIGVDLVDLDAAPLGVELAIGNQLTDGHIGGAFVTQRRQLFAAVGTIAAGGIASPQHGFEGDTRLREGVIG